MNTTSYIHDAASIKLRLVRHKTYNSLTIRVEGTQEAESSKDTMAEITLFTKMPTELTRDQILVALARMEVEDKRDE